jgi:hypothetical protein
MRRTTTAKLQKIISDNLVSVTSAVVNYDDRGSETISVEKFKEDLEFYANSGIFADTLDFTFEKISEDRIHVAIGKMSSYCYDDIDVTLQLNEGATVEEVTKQLYEDLNDRLSA